MSPAQQKDTHIPHIMRSMHTTRSLVDGVAALEYQHVSVLRSGDTQRHTRSHKFQRSTNTKYSLVDWVAALECQLLFIIRGHTNESTHTICIRKEHTPRTHLWMGLRHWKASTSVSLGRVARTSAGLAQGNTRLGCSRPYEHKSLCILSGLNVWCVCMCVYLLAYRASTVNEPLGCSRQVQHKSLSILSVCVRV